MSKKIDMKKLTQLAKESKVATLPAKGVVIIEKRPRDEILDISPNKKGKTKADSKGKETMPST